ncbi:hypothetical protein [Amycolatopsis thermoflava]|uniref:hypothetical protein n=1 Tax=Amycolatopsis thermoflava TaxID=84480 RepID=UPI000400F089|nr:hypothetical protein [Amycolatopsis thermoflava]
MKIVVERGANDADLNLARDWVIAHGVDPNLVPIPAEIVVDDGRITFEQLVRDEDGRFVIEGDDVKRTTVTVEQRWPWPFERAVLAGA